MSFQNRRTNSAWSRADNRCSVMVSRSVATGLMSSNRSRTLLGRRGIAAPNALSARSISPARNAA